MNTPQEFADALIGTALGSYDSAWLEWKEQATSQQLEECDSLFFLCEQCGWYCSTDELNNEGYNELCDDCQAEQDE